ncbi:MAG: HAD hydrolase family protein, partial [Clostridia bacterium]|nr:HAD hydrolase family protein [Clostridia bacterium]
MKKGIFDGILLLTDFDGTIAERAVISDKNRLAVEYFISEGGLFSLATGRFPDVLGLEGFTVKPNTYCVMLNGALLWAPGAGVVDRRPLDTADAREFTEALLAECPERRLFGLHTEERYIPCHVGEEY